jgi:hypothetical protein
MPGSGFVYVSIALTVVAAAWVVLAIEPVPTMLVPVAASLLPLAARGERSTRVLRLVSLLLLVLVVFAGMLSVGMLFVPATLIMAVAAIASVRPASADRV